jgi:hypothetical protein
VLSCNRFILDAADLEAELALDEELMALYHACSAKNANIVDCLLKTDSTIHDNISALVL